MSVVKNNSIFLKSITAKLFQWLSFISLLIVSLPNLAGPFNNDLAQDKFIVPLKPIERVLKSNDEFKVGKYMECNYSWLYRMNSLAKLPFCIEKGGAK